MFVGKHVEVPTSENKFRRSILGQEQPFDRRRGMNLNQGYQQELRLPQERRQLPVPPVADHVGQQSGHDHLKHLHDPSGKKSLERDGVDPVSHRDDLGIEDGHHDVVVVVVDMLEECEVAGQFDADHQKTDVAKCNLAVLLPRKIFGALKNN